jgi:homoaconitase/3-isopropylmalate dehydratase large subunit
MRLHPSFANGTGKNGRASDLRQIAPAVEDRSHHDRARQAVIARSDSDEAIQEAARTGSQRRT